MNVPVVLQLVWPEELTYWLINSDTQIIKKCHGNSVISADRRFTRRNKP